jgi:RNA polymerase sigma factor (sigma-70 family)
MNITVDSSPPTDQQLVALHLAGESAAFRQIVERYQAMVCALAYSACGDLAVSEDVAQDVFVAAWKQLPGLREPEKLRGWLGGITRNLAHNSLRRAQRTPTARAAELSPEVPAETASPSEQAVSADEASLMWRTLEGIPENYREPMVLFYREHQSVPAVAAALEISEENARQRLARGRAMLTERMTKLVAETLERSAPTPVFSWGVLLALPGAMAPTVVETALGTGGAAKTAVSIGGAAATAAAKGTLAVKLIASVAALPALLNGVTDYLRFRAHFESAATENRRDVIKLHLLPLVTSAALLGGMVFIFWVPTAHSGWKSLALVPFALAVMATARFEHQRRKRAAADLAARPRLAFDYRSAGGFLGLPWIHVRAGGNWRGRKASGWIAISDGVAIGGFFASAPVAVAPVSVGGMAIGAFALGGLALGLTALGVVAAGGWVAGGMAIAAHAAQGGLAFAPDYAWGVFTWAAHANDAAAAAFFHQHEFFRFSLAASRMAVWAAFFGWLPPLLMIGWHLWRTRKTKS